MNLKWIGAVLILAGCGSCGCMIAGQHRREKGNLLHLQEILLHMKNELQYRLTALPQLCAEAARRDRGVLGDVFREMARALELQVSPDACSCMMDALQHHPALSGRLRRLLTQLGQSLGRYDLAGQLEGLEMVQRRCEEELSHFGDDWDQRIRSYRTLALCAGAALVILLV